MTVDTAGNQQEAQRPLMKTRRFTQNHCTAQDPTTGTGGFQWQRHLPETAGHPEPRPGARIPQTENHEGRGKGCRRQRPGQAGDVPGAASQGQRIPPRSNCHPVRLKVEDRPSEILEEDDACGIGTWLPSTSGPRPAAQRQAHENPGQGGRQSGETKPRPIHRDKFIFFLKGSPQTAKPDRHCVSHDRGPARVHVAQTVGRGKAANPSHEKATIRR